MAFTFNTQLFVCISVLALSTYVAGHSYMTSPVSRSNQAQSQTGCRGPSCNGPCDIPLSKATRAPLVAARGDSITVEWPRNNHAGGFIRFAWAPTALSDSHAAFDAHVSMITCHEIGNPTPGQCAPADPVNDPNGGGSGPGDGSSGACNTVITVPHDLVDGKWTLQWAWFGGAFSLGDYFSCTDYVISGGSLGVLTPVFKGGDFSYPNQPVCKYFNTDRLHVCTNEPCQNPTYPAGARVGPPAAGQLGIVNTTVINTVPSTPSAPATVVVPQPATTGAQQPVTTGVKVAAPKPAPTPVQAPPAQSPAQAPSTPVSYNCAGATTLSSSTARFTSVDSWGSNFHGLIEIDVNEATLSNWVLEVTLPAATQITSSFNGGSLLCATTTASQTVAYWKPQSWSNNMPSGSTITVEFIAGSAGKSADYLRNNALIRVLKN